MKQLKSDGLMITVQGTSLLKLLGSMLLFIFLIFSVSGAITSLKPELRPSSSSLNSAATFITGEMLYKLMGMENHLFTAGMESSDSQSLSNALFKLSTNINLNDPRSLLGRELPAFSVFDTQILVAGEGTNYTNMPIESSPPLEVLQAEQEATLQNVDEIEKAGSGDETPPPAQTTGDKNVVYLYFTHNTESYLPYLKGVTDPDRAFHSKINVTQIGDKLKADLEKKGIGTIVDKTDIQAKLNERDWKYGQSYQASREVVAAATSTDRNLSYLIDIHRDSQRKDNTTKEINGESYAKLAFVIGGNHANFEKNQAFATELHNRLEEKYKGLSRGVMTKRGAGTNGRFNQDLSENAILIEFGGVDNTFEELNRSAAALAEVFSEYYWQAEEVNKTEDGNAGEQ